nr:hypothetical protein [Staphylococcus sp.]
MFKQRHHVIVLHIKQHFWMWLLWSSFGFVFLRTNHFCIQL